MSEREMRELRGGEIGFVFQDPMTSLNPVFTVGYQLVEPIRVHLGLSKAAARDRAAELLALVGIPDPRRRLDDYPHQFSGGMRQRVMIAIALSCDPKLLIADEPTTALDVTIQAQILEIVRGLRHKLGMGIVWITHDLGLVAGIADRVIVMYAGQVVEHGPVAKIFADPQHPYTRALLGTVPSVTNARAKRLRTIEGQPPVLMRNPDYCPFSARCRHVFNRCRAENPPRIPVDDDHDAACWWDSRTGEPRHVAKAQPLVRVSGLKMHFPIYKGVLRRRVGEIKAVDDVSFDIAEGETPDSSASPAAANPQRGGRSCASTTRPAARSCSRAGTSRISRAEPSGRCGRRCR